MWWKVSMIYMRQRRYNGARRKHPIGRIGRILAHLHINHTFLPTYSFIVEICRGASRLRRRVADSARRSLGGIRRMTGLAHCGGWCCARQRKVQALRLSLLLLYPHLFVLVY
jgi:hypothetical protein